MAVQELSVRPGARHAYVEFVDAFLELGERKRYAGRYLRLARRPVRNAFALLEELDLPTATRFLQQSVVLYVALVLSGAAVSGGMGDGSGGLLQDFLVTLSLLAGTSVELAVFYVLAQRSRLHERSFREFLSFAAITLGFSLPAASVGIVLMLAAGSALALAGLGLWIFVLVYTVRVWQRFWGLTWKRAAAYLVVAAVVSSFVPAYGL